MRVHWNDHEDDPVSEAWRVGLFRMGTDPYLRVVRVKHSGIWTVWPAIDLFGYARWPWVSSGRRPLAAKLTSRDQVDSLVWVELRKTMGDPETERLVAEWEKYYTDQGETVPWLREGGI